MCSLLVYAQDNVNADPTLDWQMFKTGHVIDISDDDNMYWGDDIQGPNALGWWQVLVVPGVPAANYLSLIMPEPVPDPPAPFRLRTVALNLAALVPAQPQTLGKSSAQAMSVAATPVSLAAAPITIADADIQANIVTIPPIVSPAIIGAAPSVIG